jgi:hypothetical protein
MIFFFESENNLKIKRMHVFRMTEGKSNKVFRGLSLDGGGSRGLFTLDLLSMIAKDSQIKFPGKSFSSGFDIIVGVSVGGIIAAAIACGIFDDAEKRSHLIRDGNQIFGLQNGNAPFLEPVYQGIEKKNLLRRNFGILKMRDCKVPLIIICVSITFYPYLFMSWLPEHADIDLSDILNGTSAAPYYFPPAKVNGRLHWDGGMFSNCPTDLTILWLKKLYNPNKQIANFNFRILSIGTKIPDQEVAQKNEPKIEDPNKCGLIVLFQLGVVKAVGGLYNDTCQQLIEYEYGKKVILRLVADLDPKFDDVTADYQLKLRYESERIFTKHQHEIEQFFTS